MFGANSALTDIVCNVCVYARPIHTPLLPEPASYQHLDVLYADQQGSFLGVQVE